MPSNICREGRRGEEAGREGEREEGVSTDLNK